ncbi:MAG: Co2+/Mg2+ efflux protein ApaG [Bacteroidetes bacterium]|nr:Co2+/Mg2+ efflux protein ApaG [Bacteroidota bacterium]
MVTQITEGVKISVETFYQEEYSQPSSNEYMFAYRITIENQSDQTVQLLRRHWYVFDSCGITREVEGEGVVGLQPVIEPGKSHQYVSGSHLKTEMGKMFGTYLMERMIDGTRFKVKIPEFHLVAPFKMN